MRILIAVGHVVFYEFLHLCHLFSVALVFLSVASFCEPVLLEKGVECVWELV